MAVTQELVYIHHITLTDLNYVCSNEKGGKNRTLMCYPRGLIWPTATLKRFQSIKLTHESCLTHYFCLTEQSVPWCNIKIYTKKKKIKKPQNKLCFLCDVTLGDLCWCHIFLWEASAAPLSSLCPFSGKPAKKLIFLFKKLKLNCDDAVYKCCVWVACTYSVCIVIQHHKVAVADVETWQVIASILGIKDVFIHHIGRPSGFWCVPSVKTLTRCNCRYKHTQFVLSQKKIIILSVQNSGNCDTIWISWLNTPLSRKRTQQYYLLIAMHWHLRSNLPNWPIFPKNVIHFLSCDLVGEISDIQDSVHLWG